MFTANVFTAPIIKINYSFVMLFLLLSKTYIKLILSGKYNIFLQHVTNTALEKTAPQIAALIVMKMERVIPQTEHVHGDANLDIEENSVSKVS